MSSFFNPIENVLINKNNTTCFDINSYHHTEHGLPVNRIYLHSHNNGNTEYLSNQIITIQVNNSLSETLGPNVSEFKFV